MGCGLHWAPALCRWHTYTFTFLSLWIAVPLGLGDLLWGGILGILKTSLMETTYVSGPQFGGSPLQHIFIKLSLFSLKFQAELRYIAHWMSA
jgi:hypothetical protein